MGAGRDRARDRLGVDVAEVLHRQPARVQFARERVQADPALDADAPGRGIGVEHAGQGVQRDQRALGHRAAVERVPGAAHAHRARRPRRSPPQARRAMRGVTTRAGVQRCEPDQLTHSMRPNATVRSMDVDPQRVAELQRQGAIQLIDIREEYEWDAGRIPGARHLEMGRSPRRRRRSIARLPVVFYCRVGGRSAMAASAFRRAGIRRVHHDGRTDRMGGARAAARAARMALLRITDPGGAARAAPAPADAARSPSARVTGLRSVRRRARLSVALRSDEACQVTVRARIRGVAQFRRAGVSLVAGRRTVVRRAAVVARRARRTPGAAPEAVAARFAARGGRRRRRQRPSAHARREGARMTRPWCAWRRSRSCWSWRSPPRRERRRTLVPLGSFTSPTWAGSPPGDTRRVFVTERVGRVRLILDGVVQATPFIDLTAITLATSAGARTAVGGVRARLRDDRALLRLPDRSRPDGRDPDPRVPPVGDEHERRGPDRTVGCC